MNSNSTESLKNDWTQCCVHIGVEDFFWNRFWGAFNNCVKKGGLAVSSPSSTAAPLGKTEACNFAHGMEDLRVRPDLTKTSICAPAQSTHCHTTSKSQGHGNSLTMQGVFRSLLSFSALCVLWGLCRVQPSQITAQHPF